MRVPPGPLGPSDTAVPVASGLPRAPSTVPAGRRGERVWSSLSWVTAGNVAAVASQWALLLCLARYGGPAALGVFALASAITTPVFALCNLQLRGLCGTDVAHEYTWGDYAALRAATTVIALILTALVLAVVAGARDTVVFTILLAAAKAVESASDIFYGQLQRVGELAQVGKSLVIRSTLSILLVGVVVAAGWLGTGVAVALLVAQGATLFGFDVRVARRLGDGLTPLPWRMVARSRCAALAWQAAPLALVMLLVTLNQSLPRYFLSAALDLSAVGIYLALASLALSGGVGINALAQSTAAPIAAAARSGDLAAARRLIIGSALAAAALGAAGIAAASLLGTVLLGTLYGPAFAAEAPAFTVLMLAAALSYSGTCLGTGVTALRHLRAQPPIHLFALVGAMAAFGPVIARHGLLGAAWVVAAQNAVTVAAFAVLALHATRSRGVRRLADPSVCLP